METTGVVGEFLGSHSPGIQTGNHSILRPGVFFWAYSPAEHPLGASHVMNCVLPGVEREKEVLEKNTVL